MSFRYDIKIFDFHNYYRQKSKRFFSAACVTLKSGLASISSNKTIRTTTTLIKFPMAGSLYSDDTMFMMVNKYVSTSRSWWKSTMDGSATTNASTCLGLLTERLPRLCPVEAKSISASASLNSCALSWFWYLNNCSNCCARCMRCIFLWWRWWRRLSVSFRCLRRIRFRILRLFCTNTYNNKEHLLCKHLLHSFASSLYAYISFWLPFDMRLTWTFWLFCAAVTSLMLFRMVSSTVLSVALYEILYTLVTIIYLIIVFIISMFRLNITIDRIVLYRLL